MSQYAVGIRGAWLWVMLVLAGATLANGLSWDSLSANEQDQLRAYQSQWQQLPPVTQQALRRWAGLPDALRQQLYSRYRQWQQLSPAHQASLVRKLDHYKRLPLEQRLKIRAWRRWVKALPESEQQRIHERWPNLTAAERRAYIDELAQRYGRP